MHMYEYLKTTDKNKPNKPSCNRSQKPHTEMTIQPTTTLPAILHNTENKREQVTDILPQVTWLTAIN